jgi:hypothetical protein
VQLAHASALHSTGEAVDQLQRQLQQERFVVVIASSRHFRRCIASDAFVLDLWRWLETYRARAS